MVPSRPSPQDDFWSGVQPPALLRETARAARSAGYFAQIARAFRWYSLLTLGRRSTFPTSSPPATLRGCRSSNAPRERAIEQILIHGKDVCDLNIERLAGTKLRRATSAKRDELLRQTSTLGPLSDDGRRSPRRRALVFVGLMPALRRSSGRTVGGPIVELDGIHVTYHDADRSLSPLFADGRRLALLCCANVARPRRSVRVDDPVPDRQRRLSRISDVLYSRHPGLETALRPAMAVRTPACSASPISIRGIWPNSAIRRSRSRSIIVGCKRRGLASTASSFRHGPPRSCCGVGFVPWLVRDRSAWMAEIWPPDRTVSPRRRADAFADRSAPAFWTDAKPLSVARRADRLTPLARHRFESVRSHALLAAEFRGAVSPGRTASGTVSAGV